jgi:hypothetical protein
MKCLRGYSEGALYYNDEYDLDWFFVQELVREEHCYCQLWMFQQMRLGEIYKCPRRTLVFT